MSRGLGFNDYHSLDHGLILVSRDGGGSVKNAEKNNNQGGKKWSSPSWAKKTSEHLMFLFIGWILNRRQTNCLTVGVGKLQCSLLSATVDGHFFTNKNVGVPVLAEWK